MLRLSFFLVIPLGHFFVFNHYFLALALTSLGIVYL